MKIHIYSAYTVDTSGTQGDLHLHIQNSFVPQQLFFCGVGGKTTRPLVLEGFIKHLSMVFLHHMISPYVISLWAVRPKLPYFSRTVAS